MINHKYLLGFFPITCPVSHRLRVWVFPFFLSIDFLYLSPYVSHISRVSWVLLSSFFFLSRLSDLSSCPGFGWDSSSLSESVFTLLSEFLLFSLSLLSNRSHSAQKAKKSIPARSREGHSLHFRVDFLYSLMCWCSRMLLNQLCPVWHHHPTHSFPVNVTKQSPCLSALLGSQWVLTLATSVLKDCKFCVICDRQACWTKQETGCVYLLHFDTELLKATQIFFLTSFISTHGRSIKAKVSFVLFRKTSWNPPTEVHYSQKISHLLSFYP